MSWWAIANEANSVRVKFNLSDDEKFPIIELLEVMSNNLDQFELHIEEKHKMNGAEGYTAPDGSFIALSEDVYNGACNGNGRYRFTVAHELGHYFLHSNRLLPRAPKNHTLKAYELSEPQANQFAAELLMPRSMIIGNETSLQIMNKFGVSNEAAQLRLKYIQKIKKQSGGNQTAF